MTSISILPVTNSRDPFFTIEQQQRLSTLMAAWREALDREDPFPTVLKTELEALVEAELMASAYRLQSFDQSTGA